MARGEVRSFMLSVPALPVCVPVACGVQFLLPLFSTLFKAALPVISAGGYACVSLHLKSLFD